MNKVEIVNNVVYVDGLDVIDTIKRLCLECDRLYLENRELNLVIEKASKLLKITNEKGEMNNGIFKKMGK